MSNIVEQDGMPGSHRASRWELRLSVEDFLYHEAELLDRWQLQDWLGLWTEEITYLIPSTDRPDGDPLHDLFFVQDGRFIMEQRINSIVKGSAWAEAPHSTTRRIISNVRVTQVDEESVEAKANFVVYRSQRSKLQVFPGHADYLLEVGGPAGFRIRMKKATLDLEELRPHGRVAIIL